MIEMEMREMMMGVDGRREVDESSGVGEVVVVVVVVGGGGGGGGEEGEDLRKREREKKKHLLQGS